MKNSALTAAIVIFAIIVAYAPHAAAQDHFQCSNNHDACSAVGDEATCNMQDDCSYGSFDCVDFVCDTP